MIRFELLSAMRTIGLLALGMMAPACAASEPVARDYGVRAGSAPPEGPLPDGDAGGSEPATCDPLDNQCSGGQMCTPSHAGDFFVCDFDASGEGGAAGDACEFVNVCDPGLFCADAAFLPACDASGCCTPYCDTTEDAGCDDVAGTTCVPYFEPETAPIELEHVGVCGLAG